MTKLSNEPKGDRPKHDPHEAGTFAAVCVDNFTVTKPNPYKGQPDRFNPGKIDNRETLTQVCIGFLTTETIEIDGVLKPRYTSFWAPMSWHEKSKLRQTVAKWVPEFAMNDDVDLDDLIGRPCMVTVTNYTKRDGSVGHGVDVIAPPMKGLQCPTIPADFERHKDREARKAAEGGAAQVATQAAPSDDSLPF